MKPTLLAAFFCALTTDNAAAILAAAQQLTRLRDLKSLDLIHSRVLTDASAVHLPKLTKMKSFILNVPRSQLPCSRT